MDKMPLIAGVDEVGRGPLAGPVVAAAVLLGGGEPPYRLADSKAISEKRREAIFEWLSGGDAHIGIGFVEHDEIDRINIHNASLLAMRRAVEALPVTPARLLIDGKFTIDMDMDMEQEAIIKGDSKEPAISAASIVAKVTRDRLMKDYDRVYPGYGFSGHKGYPTKSHKDAIRRLGPSPIHRLSFRGVADGAA